MGQRYENQKTSQSSLSRRQIAELISQEEFKSPDIVRGEVESQVTSIVRHNREDSHDFNPGTVNDYQKTENEVTELDSLGTNTVDVSERNKSKSNFIATLKSSKDHPYEQLNRR